MDDPFTCSQRLLAFLNFQTMPTTLSHMQVWKWACSAMFGQARVVEATPFQQQSEACKYGTLCHGLIYQFETKEDNLAFFFFFFFLAIAL